MPGDRDSDTGKFTQQFSEEKFLTAVEAVETPTTSNIADYVGCSYDSAYHRLNKYADEGKVRKITVGNSFLWQRQ